MDISYSADQPVKNKEHDVFRRYEFSMRIANSVINKKDKNCITIGLYGAWGVGKTSVLNFICEELNKHPEKIKIINFNPWRYKGEEDLLINFFQEITKNLDKNLYSTFEIISKKADKLKIIAPLLNLATKYFSGGTSKMDFSDLFKFLSSADVEVLKTRVNTYLSQSEYSLVVIIDDIDRLDKQEMYSIMKLVKLTADFLNTTYILSFDDKVVASAIGDRFAGGGIDSGFNFLEKIIQVPIKIPQISMPLLRNFCLEKIKKLLFENNIKLSEDENKRFERVFEGSILLRLTNPRLLVRYINNLSFSIPIVKDEINIVDFLLMEALKLFFINIYDFIKINYKYFIDYSFITKVKANNSSFDFPQFIETVNPGMSGNERDAIISFIHNLFPSTQKFFDENSRIGILGKQEWYSDKRIASEDYFRRYFTYSLEDNQLSDKKVSMFMQSIDEASISEIISELKAMIDETSFDELLTKITSSNLELNNKKIRKLVIVIIKLPLLTEGNFISSDRYDSTTNRLSVFIFNVVLKCTELDIRLNFAKLLMQEAISFDIAYSINHEIRRKFRDNEQLFNQADFLELGRILRERAIEEAGVMPVFQLVQKISQIQYLFGNWYTLDSPGLQSYVSNFINSDPETIKYLLMAFTPEASFVGMSGEWKSNFSEGYFDFLSGLIDVKEVYTLIIQNFSKDIDMQDIIYIDDFGGDEKQTFNNVMTQFVRCYEKKNDKRVI